MPWIIGIDEAGYGPNLGPFVMTSVACHLPEALTEADLWQVLRAAVRHPDEADDGRMIVADSKLVYSTQRGLHDLETTVLTALSASLPIPEGVLRRCVEALAPAAQAALMAEPWYTGATALPVDGEAARLAPAVDALSQASAAGQIRWGLVRSAVVCPCQFNQLLDQWGTKGAVLGHALGELLASNRSPDDASEPVHFIIDKHGGRNTYVAMLQDAWGEGMVVAHEEGMQRSRYSVLGLERDVRLTFQPRADVEHFCVALASMVSKYLRELLMLEFNQFWQSHVPGLRPTAGYPGDADRFYRQIQEAAGRLNLARERLWRRK
jgi:ribonuclease HII